jgi:hypothetical protein
MDQRSEKDLDFRICETSIDQHITPNNTQPVQRINNLRSGHIPMKDGGNMPSG